MAAIQEGESCQETARLVPALFLLRGISGLKNRFTIFCGKFRGNEWTGKIVERKVFSVRNRYVISPRSRLCLDIDDAFERGEIEV